MPLSIKNKKIVTHEGADVSDRLVEYLHDEVALDSCEFLLEDLFHWISVNPLLLQVYRRDFVSELLTEAQKGPSQAAIEHNWRRKSNWVNEDLDYLQLAEYIEYNSRTKEIESGGLGFLHLTGVGLPLVEDSEYLGSKGDVVTFSVSVTPVRDLLLLPVKVNPVVLVTEGDTATRNWGRELLTVTKSRVVMGRLIQGVLWELSFHGGPDSQKEFCDTLDLSRQEILDAQEPSADHATSNALSRGTALDDLDIFYELGAEEFDALFESDPSIHPWVKNKIIASLRQAEDAQVIIPTELVKRAYDQISDLSLFEKYPGFEKALISCKLNAAFAQKQATAMMLRAYLADRLK